MPIASQTQGEGSSTRQASCANGTRRGSQEVAAGEVIPPQDRQLQQREYRYTAAR